MLNKVMNSLGLTLIASKYAAVLLLAGLTITSA